MHKLFDACHKKDSKLQKATFIKTKSSMAFKSEYNMELFYLLITVEYALQTSNKACIIVTMKDVEKDS